MSMSMRVRCTAGISPLLLTAVLSLAFVTGLSSCRTHEAGPVIRIQRHAHPTAAASSTPPTTTSQAGTSQASTSQAASPPASTSPASTTASTTDTTRPANETTMQPFEVRLDGTTVSFRMIPIVPPASDDGTTPAPFWIAQTETTWDAYDVFVFGLDQKRTTRDAADAEARPSKPYISMDRGFGHAGYPALSMSYRGATAYCQWLSKKTGRQFRLPTEAEWRLACQTSGIEPDAVDQFAWHRGNARYKTHPVGKKKPDRNGLHDLYGNASEWCTTKDGAPLTMGGTFRDKPDAIGCAAATPPSPDWNASDPQIPKSVWWLADGGFVGFRVVCVPSSTTETQERPGSTP